MSGEVYVQELTPVSFLRRAAYVFPERESIVDGDRRLTWAETRERTRRLAVALQEWGLRHGDRVAFLAPNVPELLEAHFGVPWAGGVLVAINTRLLAEEIDYILRHSGARVLVVDESLRELVPEPPVEHVLVTRERGDGSYDEFLDSAGPGDPEPRLRTELDTISINYTSGTTGRPKGVMYSHRGAYLNALAVVAHGRMDVESTYLWTLPMFHCNGWCFTWGVTAAHGTHVCLRKVDPPLVWDLLERERVTHMCGAPTVMVMLAADDAARPLEVPVRYATGGAPPPPALIERAQALGFDIVHVYGLTETYGPVTVCDWKTEWDALEPGEQARLKARQGVGHVTSDFVRVVDPETMRDVPSDGDTMGEVVMRGNIVMKGYFDDPAATADVFRGGWFHSGDLGVMHPDGYIELRDRAKDIIISGGENISTIEVEQALVRHPDVLEAAVVAIPDEKWGERPKGFVTLRDGAELTEAELIAFTRGSLPGFKAPSEIEFGELPKTSTGKVKKFELRERERARRSAPA
jgi:fatty-acyl-CoA synthase